MLSAAPDWHIFWHNEFMHSIDRNILICLLSLFSVAVFDLDAQERKTLPVGEQASPQRGAPPASVLCGWDQVTSFSGLVNDYNRAPGIISFTISTDWGTEERVAIEQEDNEFEPYFLLFSRPFSKDGWQLIESEPGKLLPNVRATAWVCLDGVTPPLIDWQPGYSKPERR